MLNWSSQQFLSFWLFVHDNVVGKKGNISVVFTPMISSGGYKVGGGAQTMARPLGDQNCFISFPFGGQLQMSWPFCLYFAQLLFTSNGQISKITKIQQIISGGSVIYLRRWLQVPGGPKILFLNNLQFGILRQLNYPMLM